MPDGAPPRPYGGHMPIWIFRFSTLIAFPFLTYDFIDKDPVSLAAGLLCALIVIIAEAVFKRLRLIKIMIACSGFLLGYLLFVFTDYAVQNFSGTGSLEWWVNNGRYVEIGLIVFGVLASLFKSRDLEGLSYKGRHLKVADVTALMDGRIVDLCEINFLSGIIVIPVFVLEALNKMAASKRPAGTRQRPPRAGRGFPACKNSRKLPCVLLPKHPKPKTIPNAWSN